MPRGKNCKYYLSAEVNIDFCQVVPEPNMELIYYKFVANIRIFLKNQLL